MTHTALARTRRRRRLKYLLISLPVMIGLIVLAVKLVTPISINAVGLRDFSIGDYPGSAEQSTELLEQNILEPWIPWFNRGNALAAQGNYTAAIEDFERALERAPAAEECDVRVNLALSWERLGDIYTAGGYYQGAINLYEAAKAVIAEGDGCDPTEPSGQDLDEAGPRVQAKIDEAQQRKDASDAQPGEESQGSQQDQLDQLQQQEQQGAQENADGDAADRGEGNGTPPRTAKPW